MKHRILGLGSAALLAASLWGIGGPAQAADNAQVSILHGVPGATVDVYANGKALLKNFKPGTLTDPQSLPSGTYDLKVVKAGDGADGDTVIEAEDHVIIFVADKKDLPPIERLFQVSVTFI